MTLGLARAAFSVLIRLPVLPLALIAQGASSRSFDVAVIKETDGLRASGTLRPTPGRMAIDNIPLHYIIEYAFQVRQDQVVGAPDWTRTTKFEITGTYSGEPASDAQIRAMVQKLLQDRFGLVSHRETQDLPIYHLVLARSDGRLGPRLVPSDVDCVQWRADKKPLVGGGGPSPVAPGGRRPQCLDINNGRIYSGGARSSADIARSLQGNLRAPVVDRTGLKGVYDLDLEWTPAAELTAAQSGQPATPADGVSIFTAVQEQLGLKLEPARGPVDVVVIDAIARPTPN